MTARAALKAATRDAHERVDAAFGAHDLATRAGYARFLLGQAAALAPIEQALTEAGAALLIEAWQEHRRAPLLTADLTALGLASPSPLPAPRFADEAELAGGLYVLEGSRMGGAMLRRAVPDCFPSASFRPDSTPAAGLDLLRASTPCFIRRNVGTLRSVRRRGSSPASSRPRDRWWKREQGLA